MKHLITLEDVSTDEVHAIFSITEDIKEKYNRGLREPLFPGRVLALLFEKQSLRTRVSFEAGISHMGGSSLMLGDDVGFGKRENMSDFAGVLSEMVDVIVVRSKKHGTVTDVAKHSSCSVINGLTDEAHPCQALADLYTIKEHFGGLTDRTLAWVGDGNNVACSLARCCARLGVRFTVATPPGYEMPKDIIAQIQKGFPDFELLQTTDPAEAVNNASAVYTDVWASMGQEAEQKKREKDFADYQVNASLMAKAASDAIFMHCLPARRGEEVSAEVIDSSQSVIVTQAANRMHVQKGILAWLLGAQA